MLIGEAPGETEDQTGRPFMGRAGQLLTQMLTSVGLDREQDTYITNVVKCRPPGNRVPTDEEKVTCRPYLLDQIRLIAPPLIVLVGATALKGVLDIQQPITRIRGQWLQTPFEGSRAMAIFHPAYLLRNPSPQQGTPKWFTWLDMQEIRRVYDALAEE
jgi:DNA polymerase